MQYGSPKQFMKKSDSDKAINRSRHGKKQNRGDRWVGDPTGLLNLQSATNLRRKKT